MRMVTTVMVVFVGAMLGVGAVRLSVAPVNQDDPAAKDTHFRIDLNQADEAALQLLPGIGPRMARRIVQYRGKRGAFRDVAQIVEVKGIGPTTLKRIAPWSFAGAWVKSKPRLVKTRIETGVARLPVTPTP